jgi:signal transduction histidine kinase
MRSCKAFLAKSEHPLIISDTGNGILFCNNAAVDLLMSSGNAVAVQKTLPLDGGHLIYLQPDLAGSMQSMVIHQLRAPLTAIRWNVDLLLSAARLAKEEKLDLLKNIQKTNQHLISLVNDLLMVGRMDSGRLEVRPKSADLKDLILERIELLAPIANQKKQKIVFDSRLQRADAHIDTDLFIKTFENLLDNAIEYGFSDSRVVVTLSRGEKDGAYLIAIQDFGLSVSEEDRHKLFSKFYRSEEAHKIRPNGTGLGLYIAKLAAEANGGAIWFESSPERGTAFYFTVPYR